MKMKTKLASLLSAAALITVGCSTITDTTEKLKPMSEEKQTEWVAEFSTEVSNGELSPSEIKDSVDKNVGTFKKENVEDLLDTYLYSVQALSQKYDSISYYLVDDINRIKEENKEIDLVKGENLDKLPKGIISSLVDELQENNLKFYNHADDYLAVGIDFDKIRKEYGDYMTPYLKNSMALSEHEQEHSLYDYELSIIDFETVWERLALIDGFEESEDPEVNDYFESQSYYYYMSLLGFGDSTMNLASGLINENAVNSMKEVIEKHPDSEQAKDMQKVVDSIEAEKSYGEKTGLVANDILNARFSDYLAKLEDTSTEEQDHDHATDDSETESVEEDTK